MTRAFCVKSPFCLEQLLTTNCLWSPSFMYFRSSTTFWPVVIEIVRDSGEQIFINISINLEGNLSKSDDLFHVPSPNFNRITIGLAVKKHFLPHVSSSLESCEWLPSYVLKIIYIGNHYWNILMKCFRQIVYICLPFYLIKDLIHPVLPRSFY